MPGYKTHDMLGMFAALTVPGLVWLVTGFYGWSVELFCSILIGTFYLSPDLDLESRISRRWGPFAVIWWPYRKIVPHRHWMSHSGVSAIIRAAYLWLWAECVVSLLGWPLLVTASLLQHKGQLGVALFGLVLADLVHVGADKLSG